MPTSMQTKRTLIRVDQQSFQVSSPSRSNVRLPRFKSPEMFQKQLCQVIFQTSAAAMSLLPWVCPGSQSRTRLRTCKISRTRCPNSWSILSQDPSGTRASSKRKEASTGSRACRRVTALPKVSGLLSSCQRCCKGMRISTRNDFDYGGTSQYLMKNEGPCFTASLMMPSMARSCHFLNEACHHFGAYGYRDCMFLDDEI